MVPGRSRPFEEMNYVGLSRTEPFVGLEHILEWLHIRREP